MSYSEEHQKVYEDFKNIFLHLSGVEYKDSKLFCYNIDKRGKLSKELFFEKWMLSMGTHSDVPKFRNLKYCNPTLMDDLISEVYPHSQEDLIEIGEISTPNKKMAELRDAPESAIDSNLNEYSLKIYIDLKTSKKVLWDIKEQKISSICFETYEEVVKNSDKLEKDEVRSLLVRNPAQITYDPYTLKVMYGKEIDGRDITVINQYSPPPWRCIEFKKQSECPKDIAEFIIHLIPNKECRQFIFNWMKQAVLSRNETYLVLNGAKGVGKGIFCSLLEALVGEQNYFLAPKGIFDSNFNGFLADKRVIVLDELQAKDDKSLALLKKYANPKQSLEFKNQNVSQSVETFNSYVISNNDITDLKISPDDRRFSVVDLSEAPWNTVVTQEYIQSFVKRIKEDIEWLAQFGHWVLSREYKNFNEFYAWKGPRFYKMIDASLSTVQRIIVQKILSKQENEYSYADIKQRAIAEGCHKNYIPSKQKVGEFLQNYLHEGKHRLGSIVGDGKIAKIIPNERFQPTMKSDDLGIDDF